MLTSTDFDAFVSSVVVLVGISRKIGILSACLFVLRYNHVCGVDKLCSAGTLNFSR
jgi:hypothetical protein